MPSTTFNVYAEGVDSPSRIPTPKMFEEEGVFEYVDNVTGVDFSSTGYEKALTLNTRGELITHYENQNHMYAATARTRCVRCDELICTNPYWYLKGLSKVEARNFRFNFVLNAGALLTTNMQIVLNIENKFRWDNGVWAVYRMTTYPIPPMGAGTNNNITVTGDPNTIRVVASSMVGFVYDDYENMEHESGDSVGPALNGLLHSGVTVSAKTNSEGLIPVASFSTNTTFKPVVHRDFCEGDGNDDPWDWSPITLYKSAVFASISGNVITPSVVSQSNYECFNSNFEIDAFKGVGGTITLNLPYRFVTVHRNIVAADNTQVVFFLRFDWGQGKINYGPYYTPCTSDLLLSIPNDYSASTLEWETAYPEDYSSYGVIEGSFSMVSSVTITGSLTEEGTPVNFYYRIVNNDWNSSHTFQLRIGVYDYDNENDGNVSSEIWQSLSPYGTNNGYMFTMNISRSKHYSFAVYLMQPNWYSGTISAGMYGNTNLGYIAQSVGIAQNDFTYPQDIPGGDIIDYAEEAPVGTFKVYVELTYNA